jgi:hypothetical protein
VTTHFSRLLRHALVTVELFLFPGHHVKQSDMIPSHAPLTEASSVGIMTRLTGWTTGVGFPVGAGLLFATALRLILGPTQHPNQWLPGALSPGDKATQA